MTHVSCRVVGKDSVCEGWISLIKVFVLYDAGLQGRDDGGLWRRAAADRTFIHTHSTYHSYTRLYAPLLPPLSCPSLPASSSELLLHSLSLCWYIRWTLRGRSAITPSRPRTTVMPWPPSSSSKSPARYINLLYISPSYPSHLPSRSPPLPSFLLCVSSNTASDPIIHPVCVLRP